MNNIIPIQRGLLNKQGFPLRLFSAAFVLSLLTAVFSGWQSWQLHQRFDEMSAKHVDITKDVGRIMLLDEVLTMSARMAAASGDFSYEKRYDQFDPVLTEYIKDVRDDLKQSEIAQFVVQTDEANTALVKMERQAFALTHQGKRQEATTLLTSAEYLRLKEVYADGMEQTVNTVNDLIANETRQLHSQSLWLVIENAVGVLVILATWFFAIRSARNWAAERRAAEAALQNVQDELVRREKLAVLGQIAGSVGHELRNPLGVMSNAVFFLQAVLADADTTTREYLNIIKSEIEGSERIVSDLLDAVRTKPPHPELVGVQELLEKTLRKCAVPSSIIVKLDIPAMLSPLRGDSQQIHQVFRNLISNGVEAMPEGGALEISAVEDTQAKTIAISVKDTGIGMTPEQLGHLFQPLFTTKARGIGLGLVVVKNLTEANGGSVNVQSEIGKGTSFIVTLPAADVGRGDRKNNMPKNKQNFFKRVMKQAVYRLLKVSSLRFAVLFLVAAVLLSVMIVLTIDFLWDGRFNAELEFAGVATPFLDGLFLVVFVIAMLDEIREEMARRKVAENEIRRLNEELEAKVQQRTQQLLSAQEELVRKEKLALLGQIADNVGHELRNPLGVMNNAVYFLQTVLADADETTKEYLVIIKDEIADAERIVSDLLDAVRTKPPHPEIVELAELIAQTLRKCEIPPSITVQIGMTQTFSLRVDPAQIHQVLWNLITNGVEAMPDGGVLEIRADEDKATKTVTVSVKDNGSGISAEQQAKLFQPMFTTKARRVGLGLVVVKNLTQANGGSVNVQSALGKGSAFSVTLPTE